MKQLVPLILASASPRRRSILEQLGLTFTVAPSDLDESRRASESPRDYVLRLAHEKARACPSRREAAVLGADTTVALGDVIFGKPDDQADAARMLSALSGRTHSVFTGVALVLPDGTELATVEETAVTFCAFGVEAAVRYAQSGEGIDKAGAYAVQGLGSGFVRELRGSYTNVVGLPAAETVELLERAGVIAEWP